MSSSLSGAVTWARNLRPGLLGDPHYYRYLRGKGMLHVAPDPEADSFYWWLQPGTGRLDGPAASGFAGPGAAMLAADESAAAMRPGMLEELTRAEAQALYRKLAGARPLRSPGERPDLPSDLDDLRRSVYLHLDVLDMDPVSLPHTPADEFTDEALRSGSGRWQRRLVEREEYALTASLLPHVLALRVSWPGDPEHPAPGVVGSLVKDGQLWRVSGAPSPGMPLSQAALSLLMGRWPGRPGMHSMALADRVVSAYLTGNPSLDYTEAHAVDGCEVTLARPAGSRQYRVAVNGSHKACFDDLGTARAAMPEAARTAKRGHGAPAAATVPATFPGSPGRAAAPARPADFPGSLQPAVPRSTGAPASSPSGKSRPAPPSARGGRPA